ncbi:MAG: BspA family leucine-rich repeat surface protein [archaeon]|nr:BspA family leucine-rich repeat surface protein [archaeon]
MESNSQIFSQNSKYSNDSFNHGKNHLKFYYCSKCKQIPQIVMNKDTSINITCNCENERNRMNLEQIEIMKPKINQSQKKEENSSIKMSLDYFLSEISKEKETPYCESESTHGKIPANSYCTQCKSWFCSDCLLEHDMYRDHMTINSDGMILNYICENPICKSKNKIGFYCKNCHLHLCSECKSLHLSSHQIIDLSLFFKYEELIKSSHHIKSIQNQMEKEFQGFKSILDDLEKKIQNCRVLLQIKIKEDNNIIKFFKSLAFTYISTKNILNYNVRNNILNNHIDLIQSFREKEFKEKAKNEFNNSISMPFLKDITNESLFVAHYTINEDNRNSSVNILGNNFTFLNENNCILYIDGKKVNFCKRYHFSSSGIHKVVIKMKQGMFLENMKGMFAGCNALSALDMSQFDTSKVIYMNEFLAECSNLSLIDFTNFDTSNVIDMNKMFLNCSSLTSVDVSMFDTSNVINMSHMFSGCSSLSELDLNNFNTKKVTNMSHMFSGNCALISLKITNFNTSQVTNMSNMFFECSILPSIDLSNFNTCKVKDMSYMFSKSSSLSNLNLSSFDTLSVIYMNHMFWCCSSLSSLDISNFDTSNVTKMEFMFAGCSFHTLDLSNFVTSNVVDMKYMFYLCISLTVLDISNFNTSSVKNMSWMFGDCSSLHTLDISHFNISNVTNKDDMLKGVLKK